MQEEQKQVFICDKCGREHPIEGMYSVEGEHWCRECVDMYAWRCQDCGKYIVSDRHYTRDGNVCSNCFDNYYYCCHCGQFVYYEEFNTRRDICYRCEENCDGEGDERIGDYHSTDFYPIGKTKKIWKGLWRGLGFELEIDRDRYDYASENELLNALESRYDEHIYFEHDGSLDNGFEIISHPHTIEEFEKVDWKRLLELCKDFGYKSHDIGTCGLHVHISRNMFGSTRAKQDTAIAKVIYFYEHNWNEIVKFSRRTPNGISSWASNYCVKTRKEAVELAKDDKARDFGRYYAVNLCNSETVEFRVCRGTLKYSSFISWIDFCLTLVKNSRSIKWSEINDIEKWLKGLKETTSAELATKNLFGKGETVCA